MNNKVVLAMIASGAAGKTTLRRMLTNQDAGAEKHFGMHDCFYSNHSSCCGLKFKTKDEVLDRLHSPVAEGVEPVNHQPERGAYVPYKVGWTTFANGPAVCGLNGKDGHPGRVQTRTAILMPSTTLSTRVLRFPTSSSLME